MKKIICILLLLVSSYSFASSLVGAIAPDFSMPDQKGELHSLENFKDQWLVLYFYPKNDTPGCTVEAQKFRDRYAEIKGMNAEVVGVSMDEQSSHAQFAEKYQLPFVLLSDADEKTSEAYGVVGGFGPIKHSKRETFIVDPDGNIVKHYESVSPQSHAEEVIADLKEAQKLYDSLNANEIGSNEASEQAVITGYKNGFPVYGDSWPANEQQEVSIAQAIDQLDTVSDTDMVFTGTITQVCQKKGCWMVLADGEKFARVDFNNHSFFIPKDSQGQAKVFGQLSLKELSDEKVEHLKSDGAKGIEKESYEIKATSVVLM